MTTGQWDRSDPPSNAFRSELGSFTGKIWWKTWSGGNNPPFKKEPKEQFRVVIRTRDRIVVTRKGKNKGRVRVIPGEQLKSVLIRSKQLREKKKLRSDEQHPYTMKTVKYQNVDITLGNNYYWDGTSMTNNVGPVPSSHLMHGAPTSAGDGNHTAVFSANDDLRLLGKLKERLQGSDFNSSVFLGEGRQTLRLIADSAIRIAKAYRHLRKGDIAGTARSLLEGTGRAPLKPYSSMRAVANSTPKTMSANWLELQYGWLPLVSDAADAAQMLAHQLSEGLEMAVKQSLTKRKRHSLYWFEGNRMTCITPPPYPWMAPGTDCPVSLSTTTYSDITQRKRVTVFIRERPSVVAVLGLTDPSQVLWELLPWSFVADWFIPIGQYLDARGLGSLYQGTWVESSKIVGKTNMPILKYTSGINSQPTSPVTMVTDLGSLDKTSAPSGDVADAHCSWATYVRTVSANGPSVPMPEFKPLAKAASWRHCVNAVALLTQMATGKKSLGSSGF